MIMYHYSLVYLLVAFLAVGAIMPLNARDNCVDRLPKRYLKDFQEGPPVELDTLIATIDQCLAELHRKDKLKSMLRKEWEEDIKKVEGSYNKAIKELTRSLESMDNSAGWNVYDTFDDSFFTKELEWCPGWDDNNPIPDCKHGLKEDIDDKNADTYKHHLLYAFVRGIVIEKGQTENSDQHEDATDTDMSTQVESLLDKMETYEWYATLIALLLSVVFLFLFVLIFLKIRKLRRSQNDLASTVEGHLQRPQRQPTEPNLKEAQVVALIRNELNKRQPPSPRTTPVTPPPVTSTPSTSRGSAPAKQPSRTESAPIQKPQPKKIIAYASIPNQQGIFPMTFPRVTNKAYYQIFTYGDKAHKAYFSLVDDMQRRKSAFNAPDTVMPPSACEKRYTGAIDYNPSIRITPGEIQKTSSGKWKVTKQMLVEA